MEARGIASAALALLSGCVAPSGPPLTVQVMGCQEWPRGEACAVADAPLTLWVQGPAEVELDGGPLERLDPASVQGGLRFRVRAQPGLLKVTSPGRRPFSLPLVAYAPDLELAEVARLRRSGALAEAEARLQNLTTTTATRSGARAEAARNALAAGRIEQARALFEAAIIEAQGEGRPRAVLRDRTALAYLFMNNGYAPALARHQLDALEPLASRFAEAAADLDYFETLYASRMRAPGPGLAAARRLLARSERLDLAESALDAHQMRAALFVLVGRWAELAQELRAMQDALQKPWSACKRAEILSNLGWYGLLGHRQSPRHFPDDAREALSRARAAYRDSCPRPLPLANVELNLGWADLFAGRPDVARARLATVRSLVPDPSPRALVDRLHLEAEIHLASGDYVAAADAFLALERRATQVGLLFIRWRAAVGLGEAKEGLGDRAGAIETYENAERRLEYLADLVPLGEGRDGALLERASGAARLVAALTAARDGPAAIAAIRRARRGVFRWARLENDLLHQDLDDRRARTQTRLRNARARLAESVAASWALPADALIAERGAAARQVEAARAALEALLAPPGGRPGSGALEPGGGIHALPLPGAEQASLFVHPSKDGMIAWLWTAQGRFTATATTADPQALADLVEPFAGRRRLAVYAHPALEALDWAGWKIRGEPLFVRARVVFVADLPAGPRKPWPGDDRRAVVLADPAGALPRAQAEGRAVRETLTAAGFEVVAHVGPAAHRRVVELLTEPWDLWHYAGHGAQEGLDGIEGGIPVQDGLRFSVSDVLGLPRAPRRVVLAACDLGQRGSRAGAPGLGMAHALLFNGAEQVVAAVREVDDRHASVWVKAFFAALGRGGDFAEAARRARIALAGPHPEIDAAAFRVWTASASASPP